MSNEWLLSSCALILIVILVRFVFRKKIRPRLRYALWLAVAVRLLIPVSFWGTAVSVLNLLPEQAADGAGPEHMTAGELQEERENQGNMEDMLQSISGDMSFDISPEKETQPMAGSEEPAGLEHMGQQTGDEELTGLGNVAQQTSESEAHTGSGNMKQKVSENAELLSLGEEVQQTAGKDGRISLKRTAARNGRADMEKLLIYGWLFGAGMCVIVLSAVNWNYSRRLKRSRRRMEGEGCLTGESRLPVYVSKMVPTPCLFGLFHPAIYVTEGVAGEEKSLAYVLCHENTHYRQHDNWWALLRMFCLCLHWFNPLVWLAVHLSRQDGELACDEKVLEMLGDGARVDYGKILLNLGVVKASGMDGWQISTTMGGSRRQMKERLQMIVHVPEKAAGVQIVLLVLAPFILAVTFTGRNNGRGGWSLAAEWQETESVMMPEQEAKAAAGGGQETEGTVMPEQEIKVAAGEGRETESTVMPEQEVKVAAGEGQKMESILMTGQRVNGSVATGQTEDGSAELEEVGEPEYYEEKIPILLGGKEYILLCEGRVLDDGLYSIEVINLANAKTPDVYVDTIFTEEAAEVYHRDVENGEEGEAQEIRPVQSSARDGGILVTDLNFDGWNDLCFQGWKEDSANIPYYCMLWNSQEERFEYSVMLYDVEADAENHWISCEWEGERGQYFTVYYRYGEDNRLHMIRYVEENRTEDAEPERLDLTYVEDSGVYTLPATADGSNLSRTLVSMAKRALEELYHWTGEKVDMAYFQVSDLGGVTFAMSPEDMEHSRIFFSRYFGADTEYNLSGYEKMISSIDVASGKSVGYSPVLWRIVPENLNAMTDEEVICWYLERIPMGEYGKVKSIEQRFEGIWTVQTESGSWFEVSYSTKLREISDVTGPYPDIPQH